MGPSPFPTLGWGGILGLLLLLVDLLLALLASLQEDADLTLPQEQLLELLFVVNHDVVDSNLDEVLRSCDEHGLHLCQGAALHLLFINLGAIQTLSVPADLP